MIEYVIAWKNLRTGETFKGSPLPCKPNVGSLNFRYAGIIDHWIEEVQEEDAVIVANKNNSFLYFGLPVFEIESERRGFDQEWVICSENRAHKIATEKAAEDLWGTNAKFIIDFLTKKKPEICNRETSQVLYETIVKMQERLCESAQPIIKALIEPYVDEFVEEVIEADGLGNIISSYDGKMCKTRDIVGLNPGHGPVCFRLN